MTHLTIPVYNTRRALAETRRDQAESTYKTKSKVADVALWIMASIGAVCILATFAAYAFGFSLIMFRTGSMSPTIPTGSVALVQTVPAADLKVGDIAAVDRSGKIPITHRVIEINPGSNHTERSIRMQGDANGTPDPAPYTVNSARVVVGHVPGLAPLVSSLSKPQGLIPVAAVVIALCVWAFWPRRTRPVQTPDQTPVQTPAQTRVQQASTPERPTSQPRRGTRLPTPRERDRENRRFERRVRRGKELPPGPRRTGTALAQSLSDL